MEGLGFFLPIIPGQKHFVAPNFSLRDFTYFMQCALVKAVCTQMVTPLLLFSDPDAVAIIASTEIQNEGEKAV